MIHQRMTIHLTLGEMQRLMWERTSVEGLCWLWDGPLGNHGYGDVCVGGLIRNVLAHRLSWMIFFGDIPEGKVILHTCDQRRCWNPAHLRVGTYAENTEDMMSKGRHRPVCLGTGVSRLPYVIHDSVSGRWFVRKKPSNRVGGHKGFRSPYFRTMEEAVTWGKSQGVI